MLVFESDIPNLTIRNDLRAADNSRRLVRTAGVYFSVDNYHDTNSILIEILKLF